MDQQGGVAGGSIDFAGGYHVGGQWSLKVGVLCWHKSTHIWTRVTDLGF